MRYSALSTLGALVLIACGGGQPAESPADAAAEPVSADGGAADAATGDETDENGFKINKGTGKAYSTKGATESKLKPTDELTLIKFTIKDKGNDLAPISGIVVCLTAPDGKHYYTSESDETGFADILVPKGQKYELVYLSLGRRDIKSSVPIDDSPRNTLSLELHYKKIMPPKPDPKVASNPGSATEPGFVLDGVEFDTGKASIRPESFERLDGVVEYMTYKKSARIVISGHTDNVGKPASNKKLSQDRADSCRNYLIDKGIDGSRIEAAGYGQERPIAPNDSPEGRQRNRRIEASEL